jgi:hypothetical protein
MMATTSAERMRNIAPAAAGAMSIEEAEGEAGRESAVKLFIGSMASNGPTLTWTEPPGLI